MDTITNSMGMQFVEIPAGAFMMGGDKVAEQADDNETPCHKVQFENSFHMGVFTVTQAQWMAIFDENPSGFEGPERPVEMVSWQDAQMFIQKLNENENTKHYRLPTEAEWEYAARAGSQSTYCFGNQKNQLGEYAWFRSNSDGKTHPVGQLKPNAWGLYDMHGNVHEWCQDWFDRNYYGVSGKKSPVGPKDGLGKVSRGGDWGSEEWYCRSAIRSLSSPSRRSNRLGFRVVKLI